MKVFAGLLMVAAILISGIAYSAEIIKDTSSPNEIATFSRTISYQGILKDNMGRPVGDGAYNIIFRLYDAASAGHLLWISSLTQINTTNGLFSTQFGPVNLSFSATYFLSIQIQGDIEMSQRYEITGNAYTARSDTSEYAMAVPQAPLHGSVYRWAIFDTYWDSSDPGWLMNNNGAMYGGVIPQRWTDQSGLAGDMSDDFEVLRTLFTQKGFGGKNATVISDIYLQYSSTNGKIGAVLFRIKNTTGSSILWSPDYCYSGYSGWNELASVAVNGINIWSSYGQNNNGRQSAVINLSIPPMQTSTIIFISASGIGYSPHSDYIYIRPLILGFKSDCLDLPDGLEYVDDLDTAQ